MSSNGAAVGATRFSFEASAEPTSRAACGRSAFVSAAGDPQGGVLAGQ